MLSLPDFVQKNLIICNTLEGHKLSFRNDNLLISDADEKVILQQSCHRIFSLWILGGVSVTSGIIDRSKKFCFSIFVLSQNFRIQGIWNNRVEGNYLLRRKQYDYAKTELANYLISNKIANQIALIKSIRSKTEIEKQAISQLEIYETQLKSATENESILGMEGVASRVYFPIWFSSVGWKKRMPRTKIDPLNTAMDIGYTLLFNYVECLLNLYGFDPYVGVYHKAFYQRKSLVCDLVEPFRCIIDKRIKNGFALGQIKESDFRKTKNQYFLKIEKNRYYSKLFMEAILERKEEMFLYIQTYYRCFMREKEISNYPKFHISGD